MTTVVGTHFSDGEAGAILSNPKPTMLPSANDATLTANVGSYVWLTASNYVIRVLSLGFLSPIAEARAMRYIVDRLSIDGPVAFEQIGQNPDALLKRGEGLAEAFNVDAF